MRCECVDSLHCKNHKKNQKIAPCPNDAIVFVIFNRVPQRKESLMCKECASFAVACCDATITGAINI